MARLFEYQSKKLLREQKIPVPEGGTARTPDEAARIAAKLDRPVVVKAQVFVTARKAKGGVVFASDPQQAETAAAAILGNDLDGSSVEAVLVEEKIEVAAEHYIGLIVDTAAKCPRYIYSPRGGSDIEILAKKFPDQVHSIAVDPRVGLTGYQARDLIRRGGVSGKNLLKLGGLAVKLYEAFSKMEARAAEVNPLAVTKAGDLVCLDCRVTVDDNAVFRHPELGIEIAREFPRPPTLLERIAYRVEVGDYRGTFYYYQMVERSDPGDGYVGFHGAGGGGAMISMDALLRQGFKPANFCDTSGNPPASKVYRAARIIMKQEGLDGYFASGSGVASQEQFHSARGLVKAFRECKIPYPAVIRLGGNSEETAIEILNRYAAESGAHIETYGKDDPADFCAQRLRKLVDASPRNPSPPPDRYESFTPNRSLGTLTGEIRIDDNRCAACPDKPCVPACPVDILGMVEGKVDLVIDADGARKGKCIECLACEEACYYDGRAGLIVHLPIEGLDDVDPD